MKSKFLTLFCLICLGTVAAQANDKEEEKTAEVTTAEVATPDGSEETAS